MNLFSLCVLNNKVFYLKEIHIREFGKMRNVEIKNAIFCYRILLCIAFWCVSTSFILKNLMRST